MRKWILALALFPLLAWAGDGKKAPIADSPVVEVKGAITKVQIAMGQGMPFVEVATAQGPIQLYLGSMRYLMEQNFSPKAGESIEARGYKVTPQNVIAIQVELPATKRVVRFRDDGGWPLWMGGRQRGAPQK